MMTSPGGCRLIGLLLVASAGGASMAADAPEAPFFAAIGVSTKRDALQAAEQAAGSMMAKFRARRRRPEAVIFLDRSGRHDAAEGRAIGQRVQAVAKAPTYGTGGQTGPAGVTWWAKTDFEPTFQVLGLAGAGLSARPFFAAGAVDDDPNAVRLRAESLGGQLAAVGEGGFGLFLGAVPAPQAGRYLSALRRAAPAHLPLIGIAGQEGDYVYAAGRPEQAGAGQLVLAVAADVRLAFAGTASRNVADAEAVLAEADAVAGAARRKLGAAAPALVIAFSDPGRMRTAGLGPPGKELQRMQGALGGDVPVFGCYAPMQVGVDSEGRPSVGPGRIMLVALAEKGDPSGKAGKE